MIGWIRICRPGSILGPQQHFLVEKEAMMHAMPSIIGASVAELAKKMKVIKRMLALLEIGCVRNDDQG